VAGRGQPRSGSRHSTRSEALKAAPSKALKGSPRLAPAETRWIDGVRRNKVTQFVFGLHPAKCYVALGWGGKALIGFRPIRAFSFRALASVPPPNQRRLLTVANSMEALRWLRPF